MANTDSDASSRSPRDDDRRFNLELRSHPAAAGPPRDENLSRKAANSAKNTFAPLRLGAKIEIFDSGNQENLRPE